MTADEHRADVKRLFKTKDRGHYAAALEIAAKFVREYPGDAWWEYQYAEQMRELGRFQAARDLLLKALPRMARRRYRAEVSLARVYESLGEFEQAEQWFGRATQTYPDSTETWVYLGTFLARRGRFDEASAALQRGLSEEGDRDEVLLNLGYHRRAVGDYDGAVKCFSEALKLTPGYEEAKRALEDVRTAITIRAEEKIA